MKTGRPKTPPAARLNAGIVVRFTPAERLAIEARRKAEQPASSLSGFIRWIVLAK
jgi:hypothetical protein